MSAPDLRRQPGPHVFVANLDRPVLDDDDHHHLARVLRLRVGDPLTLSDGAGRWRTAAFDAEPEPTGEVHAIDGPSQAGTIAVALTKAAKPELVVQKATEVGIDRIVVFSSDRSVPVWNAAKRRKAAERLGRVAREAAMQSRQVRVPSVEIVGDLGEVIDLVGREGLVRADFGGAPINAMVRTVVVGPEGGWSAAECEQLTATVDLGPSVLRAETAAIVAAAELIRWRHSQPHSG